MAGTAYLTVKEVAEELRVSPATVYAWVAQGKIPCVKLHRLIRFRQEDVDVWLGSLKKPLSPRGSARREKKAIADINVLIARAKRAVYTGSGETRPEPSSIGKGVTDGAV